MRTMDELKHMFLYSSKKKVYVPIDEKDRKRGSAILLMSPDINTSSKMMTLPYIYNPNLFTSFYIDRNVMAYIDNIGDNKIEFDEQEAETISEAMFIGWSNNIKFKFDDSISVMDKHYAEEVLNRNMASKMSKLLGIGKLPKEIVVFVHPTVKDLQNNVPESLMNLCKGSVYSYSNGNEIHVLSKLVFDNYKMGSTYNDYLKSELLFSLAYQYNEDLSYIVLKAICLVLSGICDWRKKNRVDVPSIKSIDNFSILFSEVVKKKDNNVITNYLKTADIGALKIYASKTLLNSLRNIIFEEALSYFDRQRLLPSDFGIPDKRKYPMPDADHVRAAIRMFNNCDYDEEKELAESIIKKMKKFNIEDDIKISAANRFKKYYDKSKSTAKNESAVIPETNDEYSKILDICNSLSKDEFKRISFYDTYRDSKFVIKRIIVSSNGKPAGFLDVYLFPSNPDIAQIVIAVNPEFRGMGIADTLVDNLLNSNLRDTYNFSTYYWTVHHDNQPSMNLAKKHGFIDTGSDDKYGRRIFTISYKDNDIKKVFEQFLTEGSIVENDNMFAVDNMIIFSEADDPKYSQKLRRYLYAERLRNNKAVLDIYDRVKVMNPEIRKMYLKLSMYNNANLFIDLSYYHGLFLKNNMYKMDKAINFYFDFLNRLMDNHEINEIYKKRTIFIPIDPGVWPVQPNTDIFDFKHNLNPISILFRLVRTNLPALRKAWGDKKIIFVASRGYFTIDFNKFELKNLARLKVNLRKLMSVDEVIEDDFEVDELQNDDSSDIKNASKKNVDSSKAIALKMVDAIEDGTAIKLDNVSKLNDISKGDSSDSKMPNHLRISSDTISLNKDNIEHSGVAIITIDPDGPKGYDDLKKGILKNISSIKSYCIPE